MNTSPNLTSAPQHKLIVNTASEYYKVGYDVTYGCFIPRYFSFQKSVPKFLVLYSNYCIVASRNKCYYSGTQIFGGATNQDMLLNKTCFYSQIRNGADWISRVGLLVVVKMKYSSVHISSDSLLSKILRKPAIVQK